MGYPLVILHLFYYLNELGVTNKPNVKYISQPRT